MRRAPKQLPAFGYTKIAGVLCLVIAIRRVRRGHYRGYRWLGSRWSAKVSFEIVDWTTNDVGVTTTGGADWHDYGGEAVIDGIKPAAGMWLVSHERRRAYGPIIRVTRAGSVVWRGSFGVEVETRPDALQRGCSYAEWPPGDYQRIT